MLSGDVVRADAAATPLLSSAIHEHEAQPEPAPQGQTPAQAAPEEDTLDISEDDLGGGPVAVVEDDERDPVWYRENEADMPCLKFGWSGIYDLAALHNDQEDWLTRYKDNEVYKVSIVPTFDKFIVRATLYTSTSATTRTCRSAKTSMRYRTTSPIALNH